MRAIIKAIPLVFEISHTISIADGVGVSYVAATPFGRYEYWKEDDGSYSVCAHFDTEDGGENIFVRTGDSISAQQACGYDFAGRLRESLGLGDTEEAA